MILIISDEKDASTNGVINWLNHFGVNWVRINPETDIEFIDLSLNDNKDVEFRLKKNKTQWINFNDIKSVWYRRGAIQPQNFSLKRVRQTIENKGRYINDYVISQLNKEVNAIIEFIYILLAKKPSIGTYYTGDVNKLVSLNNAKKVGLNIPETIITTSKSELIEFNKNNKESITKSISDALYIKMQSEFYCNYTEFLNDKFINSLENYFFPSLIQEKLNKLYELRIFYLHGKYFSMAIFSQSDSQTEIDFRKYNDKRPNRTVPYNLPIQIQEKISEFMRSMNLNSGSIDMIVTKEKEYVFLEVNPIGQFGMVSGPCNYYLEKEIAACLINLSLNNQF